MDENNKAKTKRSIDKRRLIVGILFLLFLLITISEILTLHGIQVQEDPVEVSADMACNWLQLILFSVIGGYYIYTAFNHIKGIFPEIAFTIAIIIMWIVYAHTGTWNAFDLRFIMSLILIIIGFPYSNTKTYKRLKKYQSLSPEQKEKITYKIPHKKLWLVLGSAATVFIILMTVGSLYYGRDNQIDRIINEMTFPTFDNSGELADSIDVDEVSIDPNEDNVKPLQEYYKRYRSKAYVLQESLKYDNRYQGGIDYTIQAAGNYFYFFPKYKLTVPTESGYILTNNPDTEIELDGENLGKVKEYTDVGYPVDTSTWDGLYVKKFGPCIMGIHKVTLKVDGHKDTERIKVDKDKRYYELPVNVN